MSVSYFKTLCANRLSVTGKRGPGTLVIFLKQLGDLVLLEPATRVLAARSHMPLTLTTRPGFQCLVELMAEAVFDRYPTRGFENVWVFEPGSKAAAKAFLVRARRKTLVLRDEDQRRITHRWLYDRTVVYQATRHEYNALFYYRAVGGAVERFRPPRLEPPPTAWRWPRQPVGPYLVVNAVSSQPAKSWTTDKWIQTLEIFLREQPMPVVLTGTSLEWHVRHVGEIAARCSSPVISTTGQTSFREYIALLANSQCVLTVDGAAAHLAQAFGRPVACLFTRHNLTASVNWSYPGPRALTFAENGARAGEHVRVRAALDPEEIASEALRLCLQERSGYREEMQATQS